MASAQVELVVGTSVRGTWDMPGLLLSPPLAEQLGCASSAERNCCAPSGC